ncbi:hypothetical protein KW782_02855 [Candidatus Parcubacteria bacterium]|nr:hypothetical protein [Candidatus Parcubacteria bacterium]
MKKIIAFTAVFALLAASTPVFAQDDIVVKNNNTTTVTNTVGTASDTGGNTANGGRARNRTEGGNISDVGSSNDAGNGGSTVLGGMGGLIVTGNALSNSHISNEINTSDTNVEATPWAVSEIRVRNRNTTSLSNTMGTDSFSGENVANGKRARNVTTGGDVDSANFDNNAGNDGSHVEGGSGGEIRTGSATSNGNVVNVLNRNVTRIRK